MNLPKDLSDSTHTGQLIKSFLSHQPGPSVHSPSVTLGHNSGEAKLCLCLSTSATLPISDPVLSVCFKEMLTVKSSWLKSSTEGRNDCLFKFLALVKHDYFHSGSVFRRKPASHRSIVAFKALVDINEKQEETSENKAIWWKIPEDFMHPDQIGYWLPPTVGLNPSCQLDKDLNSPT